MWVLGCAVEPVAGVCSDEVWVQVATHFPFDALEMADVAPLLGAVALVFATAFGFRLLLSNLGVR